MNDTHIKTWIWHMNFQLLNKVFISAWLKVSVLLSDHCDLIDLNALNYVYCDVLCRFSKLVIRCWEFWKTNAYDIKFFITRKVYTHLSLDNTLKMINF